MTGRLVAYCGLICSDCPAYIATQANDDAARERVAAQWREEFNAPHITAESINCDGCLGQEGRKFSHCSECEYRACAMARNVINCAHCADYACEKLDQFLQMMPDIKQILEGIRNSL